MSSKLLFIYSLIDFDADWNSNHRLLFHSRELTPGSNIYAVKLLASAIALFVRNSGTGDKAIYKAITGATKYAVREMFLLGSTDDPEKEEIKQPSRSTPRTITPAQTNRLYTLATREIGLSKEKAKEVLQSCGYNSAKNIIAEDYERVVRAFKDLGRSSFVKSDRTSKGESNLCSARTTN